MHRRPSWGYCPDDLDVRRLGWSDRLRVVGVVAGVILVDAGAGSTRV